jgi:hypothetical protein
MALLQVSYAYPHTPNVEADMLRARATRRRDQLLHNLSVDAAEVYAHSPVCALDGTAGYSVTFRPWSAIFEAVATLSHPVLKQGCPF